MILAPAPALFCTSTVVVASYFCSCSFLLCLTGTREVYEEKLKRGNLHHDPTIKLGLGSARCPRCLSLLNSNSQSKGEGGREEREIGIEKWQERRKRESKFGILLKLRVASIIIQNGKKRENCYTRVREDRSRLLWKLRFANNQPHKDLVKSSLEGIVFDEIQKFKHSYQSETFDNSKFSLAPDDGIWQYDGLHEAYQGDCEEMLLEMQRIFYEDLRMEETKEQVSNETWEDEEDEYLARAVYEHMNLNEKAGKEVWCPICKQVELKEDCHLIYCSLCGLRLNRDDEVNLEVLRNRLDEAHSDHLDQGCKLKPKFCVETRFDLTALYITCQGCNMFEVVM